MGSIAVRKKGLFESNPNAAFSCFPHRHTWFRPKRVPGVCVCVSARQLPPPQALIRVWAAKARKYRTVGAFPQMQHFLAFVAQARNCVSSNRCHGDGGGEKIATGSFHGQWWRTRVNEGRRRTLER